MVSIKEALEIGQEEYFLAGNSTCAGCGCVLRCIEKRCVFGVKKRFFNGVEYDGA